MCNAHVKNYDLLSMPSVEFCMLPGDNVFLAATKKTDLLP